jgi:hypothetical protein
VVVLRGQVQLERVVVSPAAVTGLNKVAVITIRAPISVR